MRSFQEDFAAALRGDPGYRGIEPKTAAALFRLGLITEQQAWEGAREFAQDWERGWDDSEWWFSLAEIARQQYLGWWQRNFGLTVTWKSKWIRERRGF